jgi:hypothetical protein
MVLNELREPEGRLRRRYTMAPASSLPRHHEHSDQDKGTGHEQSRLWRRADIPVQNHHVPPAVLSAYC